MLVAWAPEIEGIGSNVMHVTGSQLGGCEPRVARPHRDRSFMALAG
jgi:hypothetical protein